MSVNKFRFISPDVKTAEIDNSQIPQVPVDIGPVVIGRATKGPIMQPITVSDNSELEEIFGAPVTGFNSGDVWRLGDVLSPTYGLYGAKAYLQNSSTLTFLRVGGDEHPERLDDAGEAGWNTDIDQLTAGVSDGGAYALMVADRYPQVPLNQFTGFSGTLTNTISVISGTAQGVVDGNPILIKVPTGSTTQFVYSIDNGTTWDDNGGSYYTWTGNNQPLGNTGLVIKGSSATGWVANDIYATGVMTMAGTGTTNARIYGKNSSVENYDGLTVTCDGAAADTFTYSFDGSVQAATVAVVADTPIALGSSGLYVVFSSLLGMVLADAFTYEMKHGKTVHAATFYVNDGALTLEGNVMGETIGTDAESAASATFYQSVGSNYEFKLRVYNRAGMVAGVDNHLETIRFNLNENSSHYIRKVFSTNPTLTNSTITTSAGEKTYWLGESFDEFVKDKLVQSTGAGNQIACLVKIESDTDVVGTGSDNRIPSAAGETGWVFAQDLAESGAGNYSGTVGSYDADNMQKLFRFVARDGGKWAQEGIKVSIDRIKYSSSSVDPYGQFDVLVRKASDSDKRKVILERFSGCNLSPGSPDYVGKKIGTKYLVWNETERRYNRYGSHANKSNYIYIVMNQDVDAGTTNPEFLPWGFYGEPIFADFNIDTATDSAIDLSGNKWLRGADGTTNFAALESAAPTVNYDITNGVTGSLVEFISTVQEARNRLRMDSKEEAISVARGAYWGITTSKDGTSRFFSGYQDLNRLRSVMAEGKTGASSGMQYAHKFTLDDVAYEVATGSVPYTVSSHAYYREDARKLGFSISSGYETNSSGVDQALTPDYRYVIDNNFARFTMNFYGGTDGLNIREKDAFRNSLLDDTSDEKQGYANYTLAKALDILADLDLVKMNKIAVPGITDSTVNNTLVSTSEERGDALAIVDSAGWYQPAHESNDSVETRTGSVAEAITEFEDLAINSSYAVNYANWFKIVDVKNSNQQVWVPSSVIALGVMSYSQAVSEMWYSPAGYSRGNLSRGAAGLPVVDCMFDLSQDDRDDLYEVNINPVFKKPEGIIVFGDKTATLVESALDRVNVRNLLIYIKNEVSRMASEVMFDPNVYVTWNRFVSKVNPFLESIKTGLGLEAYRVILDESTTTPDLVDRNIMYSRILLKPTKSINFIGIDFVVTNDGAAFQD